jgi:hypothetical protein
MPLLTQIFTSQALSLSFSITVLVFSTLTLALALKPGRRRSIQDRSRMPRRPRLKAADWRSDSWLD